ncbi:MAG TPA: type II toxin-antitoxin system VapC family toxin [Bauldia sp.]|nr:type II toxin-antitoxin system VapC family toxin [Bauldia sp.]
MILDTSALVALLVNEAEAPAFARLIEDADVVRLSAGNYLELGAVIDGRRNPALSRQVDALLAEAQVVVEPVTAEQARIAREAYRDFGRGSGHPASLNFGDCFAYALAKDKGETLLFKGDDFRRTDVRPAA